MEQPLILVIDDSQTIRKLVECHLSQAGYRVAMAADAEQAWSWPEPCSPVDPPGPPVARDDRRRGLPEVARQTSRRRGSRSSSARPCGIGPTPNTPNIPNVVDQIPKPFTPELLKSGVANALQMGAMVVQAQRTGCAMPEAVGEVHDALLEGNDRVVPAARGARFPQQPPAGRPADTGSGQGPGAVRAWPAAGSRRCTRRRLARTGWRASSRPSSPTSVRSWR